MHRMVDEELTPAETGAVRSVGDDDVIVTPLVGQLVEDIERHGEVHATFEHVDAQVECRLGTTEVAPSLIRVFDGDQYRSFDADKLVEWEVPMDVFHE